MSDAQETPAYRLEISDSAQAEADAVYLWMSRNLGPAYADRWYRELWAKVGNLVSFPRMGQRVPGQDETVRRSTGATGCCSALWQEKKKRKQ